MTSRSTEDTKAVLLLCANLARGEAKPLSPREYNACVRALISLDARPCDLLTKGLAPALAKASGIDEARLGALLGRGVQLGFALEEWEQSGIWVLSRADKAYPARLKQHLQTQSPPLLFGAGTPSLLEASGLAMVGSRNIDAEAERFARQTAALCASSGMTLVSGGARGVDQISMSAALDAGGTAVGVLADSLLRRSLDRQARNAIAEGRLLLVSPWHPKAGFSVGSAMGRNKLIYALADCTLAVSAEWRKGGTWAGAEEELRRKSPRPVFVRTGPSAPLGNARLLELGAIPWPCGPGEAGSEAGLPDLRDRLTAAIAADRAGRPAPKAVVQRTLTGIIEAEQARLGG